MDYFLTQIKQKTYQGILGINIVKNFETAISDAIPDYLACFEAVYPYASYIAANISSPNTPELRNLQYGEHLNQLLSALKQKQAEFKEMNEMELKMENQSVELDEKLQLDATQSGMFIFASYLE